MRINVRFFVLSSLITQALFASAALAQDTPSQPEAVVVPTPTVTETPTPTPTLPPSTPCAYEVDFHELDEDDDDEDGFYDQKVLQGEGASLSCLDTLLDSVYNWDDPQHRASWEGYEDEVRAAKGLIEGDLDVAYSRGRAHAKGGTREQRREAGRQERQRLMDAFSTISQATMNCIRDDDLSTRDGNRCSRADFTDYGLDDLIYKVLATLFDEGNFLMDDQCRPRDPDEDLQICGDLHVRFLDTPLSLIWDEARSEIKETIVQFPLALDGSKSWYTWRASGEMPLVVYDPQRSGVIRDASQLFGSWSFGGKNAERAALGGAGHKPERWRDGYEALESLDQDGDGKVAGAELEPLALWFDYNRDGVSDVGEVRAIRGEGVTALYYNVDRRDSGTGDLYATLGFRRLVDGREVVGQSVDWYSTPSKTYLAGVLREQLAAMLSK